MQKPIGRFLLKKFSDRHSNTTQALGLPRCIETSRRWLRKSGCSRLKYLATPRATKWPEKSTTITSSATNVANCMTSKDALRRVGLNYPRVFAHLDTSFTFTVHVPRVSPASRNAVPEPSVSTLKGELQNSAPGFQSMVLEFAWQFQQMSSFNGAPRPFNQRAILVEMGDITQPLGTRL